MFYSCAMTAVDPPESPPSSAAELLPQPLLSKLGPLKHQLLVYALIAGIILLIFGRYSPTPFRYVLGASGIAMLFCGPGFWLFAYLKLPNSAQERAFLNTTATMVTHDRLEREQP